MSLFDFKTTPKLGRTILAESQRYVLTEAHLHQRADERYTMLLTWRSDCPVCGRPFTVTTGMKIRHINRRCDVHKLPGIPVNSDRRMRKNRAGVR